MTSFYADYTTSMLRPDDAFQRKRELIKKIASCQRNRMYRLCIRDFEDTNIARWRRNDRLLHQLADELRVCLDTEYVVYIAKAKRGPDDQIPISENETYWQFWWRTTKEEWKDIVPTLARVTLLSAGAALITSLLAIALLKWL